MRNVIVFVAVCWIVGSGGCNLAENVEQYSISVLADATSLSVPDTSQDNNVGVSLSGVLGYSTASSMEGVTYQRTDTLVQFAVYAREKYDSRAHYDPVAVRYDTTIVLTVPKPPFRKLYYFELYGGNQTLRDSSYVF